MSCNTIKDLVDGDYTVHAVCLDCDDNAEVSLAKAPADMTVPHMRENLVCGECNSSNTDMKIFPKVTPDGYH